MKVFQHIDQFRKKDGIGSDIEGLDRVFRKLGHETAIVCRENFSPETGNIILLNEYRPEYGIHILHYGGSGYPLAAFLESPGFKILRYHNFTPAEFFYKNLSVDIYNAMKKFEQVSFFELEKLKKNVDCVLSDSNYNSRLLKKLHFKNIFRLPIVRDYSLHKAAGKARKKIGFVGRLVPNKKIEDIIILLYYLKKLDPEYRLVLIGTYNKAFYEYFEYLEKVINRLHLEEDVEFRFAIEEEEKEKEISSWSSYISFSEHEGFGIPLLEAFGLGVPVLAFGSTAVSETMHGGGIVFRKKDYARIAALVHLVHRDRAFRKKISRGQEEALAWYQNNDVHHLLAGILEKAV